ncbi:MAG: phenylalanine--tRNA ligase subunit beta [Candidatus Eisenbacteria bacterium]|nr:phenylalanine--tRNA ligase subunit beta [Candidatus Eisenbacteria bacterium]
MKIGYNWLREFVEIEMVPSALADCLTMLGFPVESVGPCEPEYPGIVTGQVMEVKKHPRADRLVVCEVSVGDERLHIVCGATNVTEGMKVAVARVGSVLPGEQRIESVTIRGERSEGMLCSGSELGLTSDAAGIMGLPEETRVGITLDEQLGAEETVLEIEVSHNRPDCLSMFGVAREIAAFTGARLKFPEVTPIEEPAAPDETVDVKIEKTEDCPRYCGRLVSGVRAAASPLWLRKRLQIAGFRSLNNIVDSTNYCLASFGQPIHAFDVERMKRRSILVRRARHLERIVTLDGVTRLLGPEVLLITDGELPIAIAGVMGGLDTEVVETSSRLFLESANFAPAVVKGASKKLGLETEASLRFSRGTDPEMAAKCVEYVGWLVSSLSGGACRGRVIDSHGPERPPTRVFVDPARINRILGGCVPAGFMEERLSALGFGWEAKAGGAEVSVPSFRHDVHEEVDVVEEIARSFGYDKFPERAANLSWVPGLDEEKEEFLEECADCLASLGLFEVVTKVLVDPKKASRFVGDDRVDRLAALSNPASNAEAVLRPSVLCSLLDAVSFNLRRSVENIRFFEIGKTFRGTESGWPEERYAIAAAICGRKRPPSWQEAEPEKCDIFDVKGVAEALLRKLKVDNYEVLCYDGLVVEREASGCISCNNKALGLFGLARRELVQGFGIERDVYVFELDAEVLRSIAGGRGRFEEPSRFPSVKRDVAVIVDEKLPQEEIARFIEGVAGENLRSIKLFDVYAGDAVSKGKKSLAYSLSFQSVERTLSDAQVDEIMERVVRGLEVRGAGVRGRQSGQAD